jgi:Glycosyl transferases group 1
VKTGDALAAVYASADVLVFPSLTDTFGIVILEALACGLPIAAFPVMGPLDVIGTSGCGCLDTRRPARTGYRSRKMPGPRADIHLAEQRASVPRQHKPAACSPTQRSGSKIFVRNRAADIARQPPCESSPRR